MTSLFDVLAHDDDESHVTRRKALALAHKRIAKQFDSFLGQRVSSDYNSRLAMIEEDFRAIVKQACEDVGFNNSLSIETTLWNDRVAKPVTKEASVDKESRRGKLCPYHGEVVDISLAQGEPAAGYNAMAQHAWGGKHCQSDEWGGDKCNFKPQMTTQSYWDDKKEKAEQRRQERAERAEQEQQQFEAPQMIEIDQDGDATLDESMIIEDAAAESTDFGSEPVESVEPGLSQDELMAVAASFQREAIVPFAGPAIGAGARFLGPKVIPKIPGAQKALNVLPNSITNKIPGATAPNAIADAAASVAQAAGGVAPAAGGGVGNVVKGVGAAGLAGGAAMALDNAPNPNAAAGAAAGGALGLPNGGADKADADAPDANAIHKQFSEMGFSDNGVKNMGYNPEAHSYQNYAEVAKQMGDGMTVDDVRKGLQERYKQSPSNMSMPTASVRESDTLHTVDVTKGGETPSPAIDKAPWSPKAFEKPLDTEAAGSSHPTKRVDIQPDLNEPENHPQNADRRHPGEINDIGGQVTERQDVTQKADNIVGDSTKTWTSMPSNAVS